MLLDVQESRVNDIRVLTITGKLALGRPGGDEAAQRLVVDGDRKLVFDITGVSYIDSTGIGMITSTANKLKGQGGKLVLVTPPGARTTQLLKLTQVNLLVALVGTLDEALSAFA
jgi:anti-sigma B factor antagonist